MTWLLSPTSEFLYVIVRRDSWSTQRAVVAAFRGGPVVIRIRPTGSFNVSDDAIRGLVLFERWDAALVPSPREHKRLTERCEHFVLDGKGYRPEVS